MEILEQIEARALALHPDDFLSFKGPEGLEEAVNDATDALRQRRIRIIEDNYALLDVEQPSKAAARLRHIVSLVECGSNSLNVVSLRRSTSLMTHQEAEAELRRFQANAAGNSGA